MNRIIVLLLLLMLVGNGLFAQTSKRITDLEQKRKAALEQVEKTTQMLSKTKRTAQNILLRLNALNKQIAARESYIRELNKQMVLINAEVEENQSEYTELSRRLSVKKSIYARSLRLMSRRNQTEDKLMFILSAKDLNQLARRMRYLDEYAQYQKIQAHQISRKQDELTEKRIALELSYKEKDAVKGKQLQESAQLQREQGVKKELVAELKGKEKQLKADISKQKMQAEQFSRQIQNIRKANEKASADKSKPRVAAVKGGYAMTAEEKQLSGDFGSHQGSLGYPVSLPGTIVVHFGEQKYQDLKYVQNSSKGIDIQTREGANALCVFNGVVSKVFALPGFNNSVIVRHGNFLTVYANLSSVYVKSGQKLSTGTPIGRIFTDSEQGNQTLLHFQLWKDTQRLNPESWLRSR
ncbi:MAG: peptidoglycan DD-metalloendopeptidase family protein [Bacteroidia bacterium]|nr:peptidoglycan DD-metalloendopeptidase family protein [Bacteroidia bacterium]